MANGSMLKDLRRLAEKDEIPEPIAMQLMLSAIADLYEKVDLILESIASENKERNLITTQISTKHEKELHEMMDSSTSTLTSLRQCIDGFKVDVSENLASLNKVKEQLDKNIFIKFGNLANDSPKTFWAIISALFVMLNLWFISGFRQAILLLLRVPPEIIDMLNPG